ncbi:serine O-acetyltransferase [Sphingomonas hankookensis]|uniref:serine O-acetyltransferase n=1 Tax=Sphingomonas hankookensis TaxID=563996 RepID=UPI00234E8231|nr:hypothetical protein [Sphingomonas hankookensis]WCP71912.1 hypothetical protein PPZ50_16475 [Sphingomonas hankookensis]
MTRPSMGTGWRQFREAVAGDLARFARVGGRRTPQRGFLLKAWLFLPGFRFVLTHRLQALIATVPVVGPLVAKLYWARSCRRYGSEIAQIARIGPGCYIPHPYAVVLGDCTLGRNVVILQSVTIGKRGDSAAHGPRIGDEVEIGAGAILLGAITIGDGARIGANSLVLIDVPAGAIAMGSPARIVQPKPPAPEQIHERA